MLGFIWASYNVVSVPPWIIAIGEIGVFKFVSRVKILSEVCCYK